jgi:hypothetical protein
MPRNAEPIYDSADPNPDHVIAWVSDASESAVDFVLDQPIDDDGRSEWVWLRLANGDLMLGVFPRGGTYLQMSEGDAEMSYPSDPEPAKPSFSCEFVFYGADRSDALESRIIAALETEGLDFDPLTVNVEKISDNEGE